MTQLNGLAKIANLIDPDLSKNGPEFDTNGPEEAGELKKLTVGRDALLALADEIDRKSDDGTVNPDPMKPIASSLDLFGYARRIREAVGE